jgi:2-polyprenyl-3-methyl-5-hydroxy-6-metoxy-1,4-benzoquinol methylase
MLKEKIMNLCKEMLSSLFSESDIVKFKSLCDSDEEVEFYMYGEALNRIFYESGKLSSLYLDKSNYARPDWYDHRHHILCPDNPNHAVDFWTASASQVIFHLPLGGKLLDVCSGDGWYDYIFYRLRASQIDCIDMGIKTLEQARRLHSASNINYISADVLSFDYPNNYYDTVVCRSAIEHFSLENQQNLIKKIYKTLKPGGFFVGDTPKGSGKKMLNAHENEWSDEADAISALSSSFPNIKINMLTSAQRTTIFWAAQK